MHNTEAIISVFQKHISNYAGGYGYLEERDRLLKELMYPDTLEVVNHKIDSLKQLYCEPFLSVIHDKVAVEFLDFIKKSIYINHLMDSTSNTATLLGIVNSELFGKIDNDAVYSNLYERVHALTELLMFDDDEFGLEKSFDDVIESFDDKNIKNKSVVLALVKDAKSSYVKSKEIQAVISSL